MESDFSLFSIAFIIHFAAFTPNNSCGCDVLVKFISLNLLRTELSSPTTDISLVGEDNSVLSRLSEMNLTSTSHPQELLGVKAAKWIINAIENNEKSDSILLDTYIIERNSVKKI